MFSTRSLIATFAALFVVASSQPTASQQVAANTYGQPGLIDMPSAYVYPDGEIVLTTSHFKNQTRNTFAFQIAPRLTGTFEYALLHDVLARPETTRVFDYIFDRSFSLRYQVLREDRSTPAISVGLNDFLGTGIYSSEYVVASKQFGTQITASAGIGWGRLAGIGSFDNPLVFWGDRFEDRGSSDFGRGGRVEFGRWFTGPAALFGGVEYSPTDRLTILAEYSPDAYARESPSAFERKSSFNFGTRYRLTDNLTLGGQYLYGSEVGVQLSYALNPLDPPRGQTRDGPPPLVGLGLTAGNRGQTGIALAQQGLTLIGLRVTGRTAQVEIENDRYRAAAQALGRTARVLSGTLPAQVDTFEITLVEKGLPVTASRITRTALVAEEFALDGAWNTLTQTEIADAGPGLTPLPGLYPKADYTLAPYLTPSLFDPDDPLRADIGLGLDAFYAPRPGVRLSGRVNQSVIGNLDDSTRESTSVLPRVRSDAYLYAKSATTLDSLTVAYAFRPGPNLYGKVTAGYLESMFGGIAAEALWYPTGSRLALGAEVAQVRQRDFDQRFGFQDYNVTTGHVSAYYDFGGGYQGQVDVGRYLAGDAGATLALDRTFENGWRVGAFATLTDVPFDEFGEGSFDKGIRVSVPLSFFSGTPSRDVTNLTIRPVLRDGGARLSVPDRLYETVHEANGAELVDSWGRFWK